MNLEDLLKAIFEASNKEIDANHKVAASNLADSQLVIANIAALRASEDPMQNLVSALALEVASGADPMKEANE